MYYALSLKSHQKITLKKIATVICTYVCMCKKIRCIKDITDSEFKLGPQTELKNIASG